MSEFRKILPSFSFEGINRSFIITRAGLQVLRGQLIQIPDSDTEESIGTSLLNTPVIDNVVFQARSYTDLQGNVIPYKELTIDTVIIEVSQTKNIVKTSIQGRAGTVKEYISDGDYILNIRGVIHSYDKTQQKVYPIELMNDFINILKAPTVEITSTFLNEVFGINNIVIESYKMPQQEGVRGQQAFSLNASSDIDVELEELEI